MQVVMAAAFILIELTYTCLVTRLLVTLAEQARRQMVMAIIQTKL